MNNEPITGSVVPSQYVYTRLEDQIKYYDNRSTHYQHEHYRLSIADIILTAAIPILTLFLDAAPWVKYIIALLGATSTVLTSVLFLRRSKENWIESRSICEALKSEKEKYLHNCGQYQDLPQPARDALLVDTCEDLMNKERANWSTRMKDAHIPDKGSSSSASS